MNKKIFADIITAINVHEEEIRNHETFEDRINALIEMLESAYPNTSLLSGMNDTVCMINYINRREVEMLLELLKRKKNDMTTYKTVDPSLNDIVSIIISKFKD